MKTPDLIAAFAALASWVALWINVRVTRQSKTTLVQAAWDEARTHRGRFWPAIRSAYTNFRESRGNEMPDNLDALLGSAGMPPNVPMKSGQNLRNWHDEHGTRLNADQRILWEFVVAVYPPRTGGTTDVLEGSIIPVGNRERFHESRRIFSTFFQRGSEKLSNRALSKIAGHANEDVLLLSWLEIALVRGTRDDGPGMKNRLFEFGNYLWGRRR